LCFQDFYSEKQIYALTKQYYLGGNYNGKQMGVPFQRR